ncbi:hypothetical protein Taro_040163 [Colocasia esculenta]|uniref:Uncharacterized protein n=1 Tax=Colocasia esculenta TaxID=4460 RepID=A0A843WCF9_COLES|nr:hypothetical protein [Colocasia esculenta]
MVTYIKHQVVVTSQSPKIRAASPLRPPRPHLPLNSRHTSAGGALSSSSQLSSPPSIAFLGLVQVVLEDLSSLAEMFLHLPRLPNIPSPTRKPPSSKALSLLFHTFEDSLVSLLRSLLVPEAYRGTASYSYLSRAIGVLASVHKLVDALLSDPVLSGTDEAAVTSYVASSIKLLDVCNAVSAEVERLSRGRLLLLFAVHLLSSSGGAPPPLEKARKAREAIGEWEASAAGPGGVSAAAVDLFRDLVRREAPPRRRATALGRAIYAAEAVSALIAGALVASLGGEVDLAAGTKVSGDFSWGVAFNELRAAFSGEIHCLSEAQTLAASVRSLTSILAEPASDDEGKKGDHLRIAVKELEGAAEVLTEGLDGLGGAVNGLFRALLGARNTAIQSFRLRPNKCK